jgi:hypothetical protein
MLRRVCDLVPHLRSFLVHQCHCNHAIHLIRALRRSLVLRAGRATRHGVRRGDGRRRGLWRRRAISSMVSRTARRRGWGRRRRCICRSSWWHNDCVFHRGLWVDQARDPRLNGLNAVSDVQRSDVGFKYFAHLLRIARARHVSCTTGEKHEATCFDIMD